MIEHLFMSIAIIVMVLGPVILEVYVNKINPTPKMEDRDEERKFIFINNTKTREMFSVIKR